MIALHVKHGGLMSHKSIIFGLAMSAMLASGSQAQQAARPLASVTGGSSVFGKIRCAGNQEVPMTADELQALPMQVVSTLKCGEGVSILSGFDNYTVNVRTADGKTGYVAAMYLVKAPAPKAPVVPVVRPVPLSGVVKWQAGAKGSEQFVKDGVVVASLTSNGVTVQASLHDARSRLQANIGVTNGRTHRVQVDPGRFTLVDAWKYLAYQDPADVASAVKHRGGLWVEANAVPESVQTTAAASFSAGATAQNAAYRISADPTIAPVNSLTTAQEVDSLALRPAIVQASGKTSGAVWFEHGRNLQHLILRVPVENQVFEFSFSFSPRS